MEAARGQTARLFLDLTYQLVPSLIRGQPGDTLQLLKVAVPGGIELCLLPGPVSFEFRLFAGSLSLPVFARALRFLIEPAQLLLATIERNSFLIDRFLFLLDPALDALDFLTPLGQFPVELRTQADRLVFGLECGVASSGLTSSRIRSASACTLRACELARPSRYHRVAKKVAATTSTASRTPRTMFWVFIGIPETFGCDARAHGHRAANETLAPQLGYVYRL